MASSSSRSCPTSFGGTNNPLYDLYIAQGGQDVPVVLVPDFDENGVRLPDAEQAPFHDMTTAVGAELAVAGIAAQLGAPDMSVTDAYRRPRRPAVVHAHHRVSGARLRCAHVAAVGAGCLERYPVRHQPRRLALRQSQPDRDGQLRRPIRHRPGYPALDPRHRDRHDRRRSDHGRHGPGTALGPGRDRDGAGDPPRGGRHRLRPALPTEYSQAFDDLPFGVVDKIGIAFTSDIFGAPPAIRSSWSPSTRHRALRHGVGEDGRRSR